MTKEKQSLLNAVKILAMIASKQPVFFNIHTYMNVLNLVKSRDIYGTDSVGNRVRIKTEYYLTEKGKRVLNSAEVIKSINV